MSTVRHVRDLAVVLCCVKCWESSGLVVDGNREVVVLGTHETQLELHPAVTPRRFFVSRDLWIQGGRSGPGATKVPHSDAWFL